MPPEEDWAVAQLTVTENLVKFGKVILEICEWIEIQTRSSQFFTNSWLRDDARRSALVSTEAMSGGMRMLLHATHAVDTNHSEAPTISVNAELRNRNPPLLKNAENWQISAYNILT